MNNDLKNITVTTKQLAELFGVSEGYISDLVNDNNMPKVAFNEFNLFDCVKFRFSHLEKIYQDKLKKSNDETNRGRLDAANARIKEIELKKLEGELAPVEEFYIAFSNQIKIFVKAMEQLNSFFKFDLGLNPEQVEIVKLKIDQLLTQLSEIPPEMRAEDVKLKLRIND